MATFGAVALLSGCGASGTVTSTSTSVAPRVEVTITSPTVSTPVSGSSVTVAGMVAPSDAKVDIAGSPATVSADGRFSARASVEDGTTTIEVIGRALERSPTAAAIVITHSGEKSGGSSSASGAAGASSSGGGASGGSTVGIPTDSTSCGGGLGVGAATSCAFAQNVQAAYTGRGAGTYMVYNPVTKQKYAMTCTVGTVIVTCQGSSNAYVYFLR
ncbi:MAG: hypothetical protein ACLP8S_16325 [Solirubrobacteraceae bacterium]